MGLYDSIVFPCNDCGEVIEAQSKSGECQLDRFEPDSVPVDVALDANRHAPFECLCGAIYQFDEIEPPRDRVALRVVQLKKGDAKVADKPMQGE